MELLFRGYFILSNVGEVRTRGVELEAKTTVGDHWVFDGALSYVDSEITDFPGGPCYAWQDNVQYSLSQNPLTEQDSYSVLNGNIGMSMKDDHYQVTLFVDNILDENHVTNIYQDFVTGFSTNILQFRPKDAERVFGIALRGRF